MGALFPPLACVIASSVLFDIWWIRMSIDRLNSIILNSAQGVFRNRLIQVQQKFRFDLTSLVPTLWKGICAFIGIWAFVLYDINSTEGSLRESLTIVCLMLLVPYPLYIIWKYRQNKMQNSTALLIEDLQMNINVTENPILGNKEIDQENDDAIGESSNVEPPSKFINMYIE
jgi:hypothetical protein